VIISRPITDQQLFFPEGTRSKTGQPKHFLKRVLKPVAAPSAYVATVSINNSGKWLNLIFPVGLGNHLTLQFISL
jgi:1-acyl-sn-glycerol-3-phosphate acyltransferase